MRAVTSLSVALAMLVAMSVHATATVNITFVEPETFHDDDFRRSVRRADIITEFSRYFKRLGDRYLKDNQTLSIDVLDAELAGRYEPWRDTFSDVRILRDVTPPRFKIRYSLEQNGEILMRGEETLTDINYLQNPSARSSMQRFPYEKDMLQDWFHKRFAEFQASRR